MLLKGDKIATLETEIHRQALIDVISSPITTRDLFSFFFFFFFSIYDQRPLNEACERISPIFNEKLLQVQKGVLV